MTIREALPKDLPALGALYRTLFEESAVIAPNLFRTAEQDEQFLRNTMETEYSLLLVAEDDGGAVIGFALAQQQMTPPFACFVDHRYAYLMDLAVSAAHRGRGVGTRLVEEVRAWARGRGLSYLELNVLAGNRDARRLYERLGFSESMINLKQML